MKYSALMLASLATPAGAHAADAAQNYPARPIRLIMPIGPGSANDTLGRIVANKLSQLLGQQIVVDNRAGAGGLVGMDVGANAAPDGYTLPGGAQGVRAAGRRDPADRRAGVARMGRKRDP